MLTTATTFQTFQETAFSGFSSNKTREIAEKCIVVKCSHSCVRKPCNFLAIFIITFSNYKL